MLMDCTCTDLSENQGMDSITGSLAGGKGQEGCSGSSLKELSNAAKGMDTQGEASILGTNLKLSQSGSKSSNFLPA